MASVELERSMGINLFSGEATMRQAALRIGLTLFAALTLSNCSHAPGGGGVSESGNGSGTAPFALTISDAPPAGVTVLTFQLTITGATLQPGNVTLLNAPIKVDLTQLQNESVLLSALSIPAATYNSLDLTFSTASLTILNSTGASIGTCLTGTICTITPTVTPMSVTLNATSALTVTSNTPAGLQVEAVLSNIIQSDLSLNLAASNGIIATPLPSAQLTSPLVEIDDVVGQVTSVGTNQFTLLPIGGLTLTSGVSSSTVFGFPSSTCAANNFSCVAVNQILEVNLDLLGNGKFQAISVVPDDATGETEVQGTITSIGAGFPPSQFHIVVNGAAPPVAGVSVGNQATVTLVNPVTFLPDPNQLTLPGGVSFTSASDLLVGQNVMVQVKPGTTISTSRVVLRMSQITAQVGTIGAPSFTLVALPSLFTTASPVAINQILAQTSSQTIFFNLTPPSLAGLAPNSNVSVKGLLFNTINTAGSPTLVTEKVRGRDVNGL
jgi:hypothetical protein